MTRSSGIAALTLGCAVLAGLAIPAVAAVPPAYQRVREIVAVAEAAAPKLREPIEAVQKVAPGRFEVRAGACRLEVRIVPAPPSIEPGAVSAPGPLPFAAIPAETICR